MALGILVLMFKLPKNIRQKLLGVDVYVDILFSISLLGKFGTTYSGTTAAIVAGLGLSAGLFLMKKIQGYQTLELTPRPHWVIHTRKGRKQ